MNKSLLIQNGIAGGIAGTVADGLFNNEDEHHYAKSAFMGTLAGVGATALHQSIPSAAKAPAEHVPTPVANVPPAAPIAPTPQPAPAQPKPAATTPVQQQTAPQQPAAQPKPTAAPIVEQPKPAVVAPQPAAKPIEQPKPKPKPEPEPQPVVKAEAATAPKPPEPVVPKAEPQPAPMKITPIEPKQAEPPKAVVPVKPSEEPKQEFVGPKDKPLSRKLTKTINSVKQAASGVGNGITDAAKRLSATASQLKIPPIQINVPQISQNIREKGRTVASGLARSAQALSIAAIASMDMGGGHAVVQHAFEAASHSVQVQASMATSTMTKAVNNITEAVGNYHPMQGVENAINNMHSVQNAAHSTKAIPKAAEHIVATPKAVQSTVAIPEAVKNTGIYQYADDTARRMVINKLNHNDPFIVVDPRTGSVNTYDATGNSMDRHSALFGLSTRKTDKGISSLIGTDAEQEFAKIQKKDEEKGFDWMDKKGLRVTDSGIFDYEKRPTQYGSQYGSEGLQNINGFGRKNGAKGLGIAIHNVYLGTPSERRPARLASKTIGDNFISYGCINMNPLDLQRKVLPKMNHSVKVAVLPYNRSATTPYLGLSANPMADNTEVAKQISSTMHPSSNFLVADKKDGLMGLYSPKGDLMEYHHVAQGRDSAKSEVFQGGRIPAFGADTTAKDSFIDSNGRKITPSGVFNMEKYTFAKTGDKYLGDANYDRVSGSQFAIHNKFFPNDTRALNTISNGCLLPDGLNMQKLLPKLGDKTIVAVMPNKGKLNLFK